jgi:metal-sulfur cluster biosynthetic enzyme/Fe-S cluster assembly iron-binding protein IscA
MPPPAGGASDRPIGAAPPTPVRIRLAAPARDALRAALGGRPAGSGIRIWVERGMHPHAQMMVDRPSPRDIPLEVDGVLLLVDEASTRFLLDTEIRYRTDQSPPGFEVVGPFLPSRAPPPSAPVPAEQAEGTPAAGPAAAPPEVEERVRSSLKNIYDPEIPMNIIDLGLVYGVAQDDRGAITIRMTMTSPGCPAIEELMREVERAARDASGAPSVRVELVWEPPWGPERMTDFARRQFGYA